MPSLARAAVPLALAGLLAPPLAAAADAPSPRVAEVVAAVSPERLNATVAKLVSFGTRHTLSDPRNPARGIGAARSWIAAELAALARDKGSRLQPFEDRFTAEAGPRIPRPTELVNVGAILPGTDPARAKEAVVLTGHYDSRASDVLDATSDAPGAVDDASGVALLMEVARVLAKERPAISLYLVAVAGEEQGLVGSAHLARRLRAEGVDVVAMISVDIAGNIEGQDGVRDDTTARLFSEGVPAVESPAQKKVREAIGGENDSASREWARYVARTAQRYVENLDLWVMLRQDRVARGSDNMSFAREGFTAIRLTETHEHYDRQHQDVRTVAGRSYGDDLAHYDARYAAKLTRALVASIAHLAAAPAPVKDLVLGGVVSTDTKLRFTLPPDPRIVGIVLYRRRADSVTWQRATRYPRTDALVLKDVVPDNFTFAVATVDAEGNESLPAHPVKLE
ncbi:MAG TPA: M20/M25/M40 family metallo-hydrolase [Anaeromyxobacter sp.]